ncbi:MAG: acetylserotonin O-methyltransferase [Yoonia sp.]|uniref:methyltransferase n=1 Tax=Yoonia sp. TaxID=2212373 RepID=UPI00273EEB10|nr:methyltransferase [Yoonia sp.]MDP5083844.1 acetylserotonin O-methyltransferase [Yoonia sp.]MDP5358810.1 acetylserotonin O-methyltransferase [Paracoccaceae bacterium]MDP5360703.1 acetylserotonin O-methyltransferase [Paracoccaceae bacterium]
MTDLDLMIDGPALPRGAAKRAGRLTRLLASRGFQTWAARFPLTRRIVRAEGEAMFDLVAGFCHSQILQAFVRLNMPQILLEQEMTAEALAMKVDVPPDRMPVLLAAATAIGLIKRRRSGRYALTTRGAALAGVPGLAGMIDHHDVLYLDLADPVAFFRGEVETELAEFWPYVFGAGGATDPATTATYSQLMADSQALVAEDTLAAVSLKDVQAITDIGGGTGAFLTAVGAAYPDIQMTLFDLPAVAPAARERFAAAGLSERADIVPGSFRDDPLPEGADMISLVRVLYDHADATVAELLKAVHAALPDGGRILISEPMTGGAAPQRAGDAYFALYCMAMRTGRARSAAQIAELLRNAGFEDIKTLRSRRPFITSVVTGVRKS